MAREIREYSAREEFLHSAVHGVGAVAGGVGALMLIYKVAHSGAGRILSVLIYGAALFTVYLSSCLYHAAGSEHPLKKRLEVLDHSAIYLLIFGTYVPSSVSIVGGALGRTIITLVAVFSFLGVSLSWINLDRYKRYGFVLYILAGGVMIPFLALGRGTIPDALPLMLLGVIFYTVGVFFYKMQKIPYAHLCWHILVMAGSLAHYIMIYSYCS